MAGRTQKVFEVDLENGEVVVVEAISPLLLRKLWARAEEVYPDPDPRQYDQPLVHAAIDGLMKQGEESDAYKRARMEAFNKQNGFVSVAVIEHGVVIDTKEGREATLTRLHPKLERLRQHLGDAMPEDDWQAAVMFCLISTRRDVSRIVEASKDALKEEEVKDWMRVFQRPL